MGGVREGIDFFPLSWNMKSACMPADGSPARSSGGRPSQHGCNPTARLTDRPLRPLFQDGMRNEVQVIMFSLSSDGVNPLDILAINAASAAIMISDIPWNGPVGAVRARQRRVRYQSDLPELDAVDLDLRIAGRAKRS